MFQQFPKCFSGKSKSPFERRSGKRRTLFYSYLISLRIRLNNEFLFVGLKNGCVKIYHLQQDRKNQIEERGELDWNIEESTTWTIPTHSSELGVVHGIFPIEIVGSHLLGKQDQEET